MKDSRQRDPAPEKPDVMVYAIFLQYLFNLSDPQHWDQLIYRLSFVFNCIRWNLQRIVFFVHGSRSMGVVAL